MPMSKEAESSRVNQSLDEVVFVGSKYVQKMDAYP